MRSPAANAACTWSHRAARSRIGSKNRDEYNMKAVRMPMVRSGDDSPRIQFPPTYRSNPVAPASIRSRIGITPAWKKIASFWARTFSRLMSSNSSKFRPSRRNAWISFIPTMFSAKFAFTADTVCRIRRYAGREPDANHRASPYMIGSTTIVTSVNRTLMENISAIVPRSMKTSATDCNNPCVRTSFTAETSLVLREMMCPMRSRS